MEYSSSFSYSLFEEENEDEAQGLSSITAVPEADTAFVPGQHLAPEWPPGDHPPLYSC